MAQESGPQHPVAPDYPAQRRQMVEQQLKARAIRDSRVLEVMGSVPREAFVPAHLRHEAYEDWPLPIGYGQTISQPFTVAFMAEALQLQGNERVLEIGTGSGYGAAVLSRLARDVHSIERIAGLARQAEQRLIDLGYSNVTVHVGDGSMGLPAYQPFDAIVSTAAATAIPEVLLAQLAHEGRLVIPVGPPDGGHQMYRITRQREQFTQKALGTFSFVPLIGGGGE